MTNATIKPTMTDLGVISRMCEGLMDGDDGNRTPFPAPASQRRLRDSMQESGCASYWISCSALSGTRCKIDPTTSAIAKPSRSC